MSASIHHKWEPIQDLPLDWRELGSSRLKNLAEVWQEQKGRFNDTLLNEFMTRLKREWAIETGMIENLYTLDRGLTQTLIEHGVDILDSFHGAAVKEPGRTGALIRDQEEVVEGLFAFIKGDRKLSTSYIKEIHQTLTRNQETVESLDIMGRRQTIPLERGVWKKLPNNPTRPDGLIHEYCPPPHVASEIDQLLLWHSEHEAKSVPPEIEAAWLHHRFTQIHPFQDGNGRVARALATLILIKAEWFPLIVPYDERKEYLDALEAADGGDLKPLIDFFSAAEQKSFLSAMNISATLTDKNISAALLAIDRKLESVKTREMEPNVWEVRDNLQTIIKRGLTELSALLGGLFEKNRTNLKTAYSASSNYNRAWFRAQLLKKYGFNTDLREDGLSWHSLSIEDGTTVFEIVVSIHPVSRETSGVFEVTAFCGYSGGEPLFINDQPFIFTYKDTDEQTQEKFETWLNETLAIALTEWQAQL